MDPAEYLRHRQLHAALRDEVSERDNLNLDEELTTYGESGIPSPYGRIEFTAGDSPPTVLEIVQDRATVSIYGPEQNERLTARVDLREAYKIGEFETGELDDLPAAENQGNLTDATEYVLSAAESIR